MLKTVTFICLLLSFAAIAMAVICHLTKAGPPIAVWMALFLVAFGLAKGLVGVEKILALRAMPAGGPDPRADFANHFLFYAYIATKLLVWGVAWSVASLLLSRPDALTFAR